MIIYLDCCVKSIKCDEVPKMLRSLYALDNKDDYEMSTCLAQTKHKQEARRGYRFIYELCEDPLHLFLLFDYLFKQAGSA